VRLCWTVASRSHPFSSEQELGSGEWGIVRGEGVKLYFAIISLVSRVRLAAAVAALVMAEKREWEGKEEGEGEGTHA
jgi:hypothetical protein